MAVSARNLGVTLDFNFNFRQHISTTCRCCFYHIRYLRHICRYMHFAVAKTIATVLISSILDYYNSLYHNIALKDILKLQRVQTCLARVVTRSPRFSHSEPVFKSLHWVFKICTISYQALSSKQPAYLHSLLTPARQPRVLRSSNYNKKNFPVLRQMSQLELFSITAPNLWNSLPVRVESVGNITTFRRKLKTLVRPV